VNARLKSAGFDDAMIAALAAEDVLADETPVSVLDKTPSRRRHRTARARLTRRRRTGKTRRVHRSPDDRRLRRLPAPSFRIAGIQQCCQRVIRRCRAVQKLGPGGVQDWAGDIIAILGEAHRAVEDARARGSTALDQQVLDDLRERYDTAVKSGIIHNRLRDWGTWNHPGYSLACWLRDYKEQVFLFTRDFNVDWTNNVSERGAKAAKRH